jgi:deoxyribodipyrimidine photo-lyase
MASTKRKAATSPSTGPVSKKARPDFSDRSRYKESSEQIKHGIVVLPYYPPEMTDERAREYIRNEIERPIETLQKALQDTVVERKRIEEKMKKGEGCVVFWFKNDLRTYDNKALHLASQLAKEKNVPLIAVYLISPQDWEAHLTSAVRVDFILRSLEVLKKYLAELDIPLYIETVTKRKALPERFVQLCQGWQAKKVYCNMEYEVDELRREAGLTRDLTSKGISFAVEHDTCVVEPGVLKTKTGGQISVYTPWYRRWVAHLNANSEELREHPRPEGNHPSVREKYQHLFDSEVPEAPKSKSLTDEKKNRFRSMWPAGEHEAMERLRKFVTDRIERYHETRNLPASNGTAVISVHLAAGTLAARTAVRLAQESAPTKHLVDDRKLGHPMWIGELAWRDFYKHVLVHWPFVCMNKSFKPEYTGIRWEYNVVQFEAWCEGKTGYPIVDAAMRQLNHTGWMHNRCRMVVASFLAKDLLIDWRMGERYFMEHLVDGDFASNNGGWGFSASCGVDPQPYFRIFNPLLQSEKFDPEGQYLRKWVPELKELDNKTIHDPYGRGGASLAKRAGYPKPIIEHKGARERALARYKEGIGSSTT